LATFVTGVAGGGGDAAGAGLVARVVAGVVAGVTVVFFFADMGLLRPGVRRGRHLRRRPLPFTPYW
jgi:hypothetical protein